MARLTNSVLRMVSKRGSSSRTSNDDASVNPQTFDDNKDGRSPLESVGSVYSHTSSAHNSHKQAQEVDGDQQNPYSYLHNDNLHERPIAMSASNADIVHTTRRMFQPPARTEREQLLFSQPSRRTVTEDDTPRSGAQPLGGPQLTYMLEFLFEEEEEDENIRETKREIRRIKIQDVNSTRNMLQMAHGAYETGSNTLQTLYAQGDRLHNAEQNLIKADNVKRIATRKLKELKQADKMLPIKNPFTAARNERAEDNEMLAARRQDRAQRDLIRAEKWEAWRASQAHKLTSEPRRRGATRQDVLHRAKYQFEEDSEDDRLEDMFDDNVEELVAAVQRMKGVATAVNTELDHQNGVLDRMGHLTDRVDDGLALNLARLDRFH